MTQQIRIRNLHMSHHKGSRLAQLLKPHQPPPYSAAPAPAMQSSAHLRRLLPRLPVLRPPPPPPLAAAAPSPPPRRSFSFQARRPLGNSEASTVCQAAILQQWGQHSYSSEANKDDAGSSESVAEIYQKMLQSIEAQRSGPPNAWLWSLVKKCSSREDIELLFQILQKLRVFRLSNLRIMENFNSHLCMKVSEACARADAVDFGIKTLWKHNIYGLTPSIASAHYLLCHAKEKNDIKLMKHIMHVLQQNSLPLQPGTADIVFSICYNANNWDMISKFSERFIEAGVNLRQTSFDTWMQFAAKIGDAQSIWRIQKLRSNTIKRLSLASVFSCAKGYLLEHNPESAATTIHLFYQDLPDHKKAGVKDELQKLISQWPHELVKMQKEEDREALSEALRTDITSMITSLINLGLAVEVNTEELTC